MTRSPERNPLMHVSAEDFQRAMRNIGIKSAAKLSKVLGYKDNRQAEYIWNDPQKLPAKRYVILKQRIDEILETWAPYFYAHRMEIADAMKRVEQGALTGERLGEVSEAVDLWFEFSWTLQTLEVGGTNYMKQESDRQELVNRCLCDGYRLLPRHGRDALWEKLDSLLEDLHSEEGERIREWIKTARLSRARSSETLKSIDGERFEREDTVEDAIS